MGKSTSYSVIAPLNPGGYKPIYPVIRVFVLTPSITIRPTFCRAVLQSWALKISPGLDVYGGIQSSHGLTGAYVGILQG